MLNLELRTIVRAAITVADIYLLPGKADFKSVLIVCCSSPELKALSCTTKKNRIPLSYQDRPAKAAGSSLHAIKHQCLFLWSRIWLLRPCISAAASLLDCSVTAELTSILHWDLN